MWDSGNLMTRRKTNYSVILLISSGFTDNSARHQTFTKGFSRHRRLGWEGLEKQGRKRWRDGEVGAGEGTTEVEGGENKWRDGGKEG